MAVEDHTAECETATEAAVCDIGYDLLRAHCRAVLARR
jgi:hypothetical protein